MTRITLTGRFHIFNRSKCGKPDMPKPEYSENSFAVNFTAPLSVRVATKDEWRSASRIWTKSHLAFSEESDKA
jgi:hypothetical protein